MEPRNFRRHALKRQVSKQKSHPNAKMISMRFFVWWSFIFLMHHMPIKIIGYVTDVIEISSAAINDIKT